MKNLTTGKVTQLENQDTPTVCLPNDSLNISISGPYREKERKLWAFLIHYAFESLGKKRRHTLECHTITHIFRAITGCGRTKDLWKYIKNLTNINIEWSHGDIEGAANLLSYAEVNHKRGVVEFEIPTRLEEIIQQPEYQFSRLRTHFLIGLSGKYSVSLYLFLEMYANRNHPIIELTIEEIRDKLRVEEGKLKTYSHLKQRVIDPAIKEINEKTIQECENNIPGQHGAGFTVEIETIKKTKKVIGVRFIVKKHSKRLSWEGSLKKTQHDKKNIDQLPPKKLNWDKVKSIMIKSGLKDYDKYTYEQEWRKWLSETGKSDGLESPEGSYVGFFKKKAGL